jgi:hypothetical protein
MIENITYATGFNCVVPDVTEIATGLKMLNAGVPVPESLYAGKCGSVVAWNNEESEASPLRLKSEIRDRHVRSFTHVSTGV